MRPEPEIDTVPAPLPPCAPHSSSCRWWPYSNSNDFQANAALILIILLTSLICALVLNTAIRCFLRGSSREDNRRTEEDVQKPDVKAMGATLVVAPTMVFSAGMKMAECAICLSEFLEGEGVQVLGRCKHGFHVQCIQKWLSSHTSCPTCRQSCLASSSSSSSSPSAEETETCYPENGDNTQIQIHGGARESSIEHL